MLRRPSPTCAGGYCQKHPPLLRVRRPIARQQTAPANACTGQQSAGKTAACSSDRMRRCRGVHAAAFFHRSAGRWLRRSRGQAVTSVRATASSVPFGPSNGRPYHHIFGRGANRPCSKVPRAPESASTPAHTGQVARGAPPPNHGNRARLLASGPSSSRGGTALTNQDQFDHGFTDRSSAAAACAAPTTFPW